MDAGTYLIAEVGRRAKVYVADNVEAQNPLAYVTAAMLIGVTVQQEVDMVCMYAECYDMDFDDALEMYKTQSSR
jgi:hypothetical protein